MTDNAAETTNEEETTPDVDEVAAGEAETAQEAETPAKEEAPSEWPSDWREKMATHLAAGDKDLQEKHQKRLERFNEPEGLFGQNVELERLFKTNQMIKRPGDDATPEEKAEFAREMGAPEDAKGYVEGLELPSGLTLGDEDMAAAADFAEHIHETGMSKDQFSKAMEWYAEKQVQLREQQAEQDSEFEAETIASLREEWGPRYKRNMNSINALFSEMPGGTDPDNPDGVLHMMNTSRTADGRLWANNPDMIKALASWARKVNPAGSVTEDGMGTLKTVQDELKSIREMMRTNRTAYNKDPSMQARFAELLEAEASMK